MVVRTLLPRSFWHTGFATDDVDIRFGILRPLATTAIGDWQREPLIARIEGISGVVTQVFGVIRPRTVSYRLLLEAVVDAQVIDGLLGQTGTLTLLHGAHTVPVTNDQEEWIHGRCYDHIPSVLLIGLGNREVFVDETVEVDATFQLDTT